MKHLIEMRKFTLEGAGQQLLSDLSGIRSELLDMYRLLQENKIK